ncbi:MAG: tagaturonate reductase [Chloroflexi bacterium]|nr:tagaturonate reductase [Chloroflexota bacterium]
MPRLSRTTAQAPSMHPERIVQFGGGNFLRAFVEPIIETLNQQAAFASSVVIVKATPHGSYDDLMAQDGLYHVRLHDLVNGQPVAHTQLITCVSRTVNPYADYASYLSFARQPEIRFIVSNTTEAGIAFDPAADFQDRPSVNFPAKLTAFLYERYRSGLSGCIILPTELIEDNGTQLKQFVLQYAALWQLDPAFAAWLESDNLFCNTLVDRIVSGFPKTGSAAIFQQLGFEDRLFVEGEAYHSWVIEAPPALADELPITQTDLNIKIVADVRPYREMKVRILNGAHTSLVPLGTFLGLETVRQAVEDDILGEFLYHLLFEEIIPTLNMPEAAPFAESVLARFRNPFLQHRLQSIALNSLSKFRARLLPSLIDYTNQQGNLPDRLILVFAVLIRFYKGEWHGQPIPLNDDPAQIAWFRQLWESNVSARELCEEVVRNQALWGTDLSIIPGLTDALAAQLEHIETEGTIL